MSVNNNVQEIPILVIYFTQSKILMKKKFGSFSNFGLLLEYFNKNIKNDLFRLKEKYLINNYEIKSTDLLIDIIQLQNPSIKINNAYFSIEIEEINSIGDENRPIFKKILQPIRFDCSIYIFIPEYGSMSLEQYPENIKYKYELEKFNLNSAYCNSPNALYISGGLFEEKKINLFWIIDNNYYSVKKINMLFPKAVHSMTYIYNNGKEIIFIAGGDDLKTFYYDIKNNTFVEWGDMNGIHYLPGLIHLGNYLYSFHLIKDENNKIFFERTNLNDDKHIWEKIYPLFEQEEIKNNIINNEFGVCPCNGGRVNLCGGNFHNPNSYLYDINKNTFLVNEKCKNQFLPLLDKNFYKINDNHNIALPGSLYRHKQIAVFNKKKCTLRIAHFSPSNGNQKIKYKNIHKKKDSINGKVIIEINIKDINKTNDSNQINNNLNIINNNNGQKKINDIANKKQIESNSNNNNNKENQINKVNNKINNLKENINSNEMKISDNGIYSSGDFREAHQENNNINKNVNIKDNDIYSSGDFREAHQENINSNEMKISDNGIYSSGDFREAHQENNNINKNVNIKDNEGQINFHIEGDDEKIEFNDNDNDENINQDTNNINEDNNIHIDNDNNIVSENEKNADYIIAEKSDGENIAQGRYNNHGKNEIEEITEENNNINELNEFNSEEYYENNEGNEYEDTNEEMEEIYNDQYYDGNGDMMVNGDGEGVDENVEEEEEEGLERDRFELTIVQNIGEDIIQIENYPVFYFDENNFCDYEYKPEENK